MEKSYSELITIPSYEDRFRYLMLRGHIGNETFGPMRILNQTLYRSNEWKSLRDKIIVRDNACDLASEGYNIFDRVLIHHINPITIEDIVYRNPCIFDPNNLITIAFSTHNAIHYGDESILERGRVIERTSADTCPWRK